MSPTGSRTELALLSEVSYRGREITGPLVRNLLAALARDLHTGASSGRLAEELWPDRRPENPGKALQVLVFRARAQVPDVIVATPTGYRLDVDEDRLDSAAVLVRASAAARHAKAGDHAASLEHAEAGLALWGDALPTGIPGRAEPAGEPLEALRADRAPTYRALLRARALALSRVGRPGEALEPLTRLAGEAPRDEEVLVELLRSEAAARGPAAALARYDGYRRRLRDELGADPGPALRELHQVLLAGEAPVARRTVPHEPNPLLGREDDLAAVTGLLRTSRVVTIMGPGGLGKTRLANAVSRAAEERVVHVVPLAGVRHDGDVAGEVAGALGVGEARATAAGPVVPADPLAGIVGALGPGRALLVLDNCEQVIAGVADLVRDLVAASGQLRVLTTSRSPLGLSSETVYPLPELDGPTAVELFRQRARAVAPRAELPEAAVADLVRHLDGLPLAIELAAARVRLLSVAEIADGLRDRFGLLRGHARDAPQRHRTLHAVVDWSWALLTPEARRAMRLLSVLPGGFGLDAARELLGDGPDFLDLLEQLVDQSLLKTGDGPAGMRFRMLETVREFAAAQREAAGETGEAVDGFLAWARAFGAARHETVLGEDSAAVMATVRTEADNLLHAIRLAQAREDGDTVAAAAAVLAGLWTIQPANYPRLVALAEESAPLLSHLRPAPDVVEPLRTAVALFVATRFLMQGPRASRLLVVARRLPPGRPDTFARAIATILADRRVLAGDLAALQEFADRPEPVLGAMAGGILSYVLEGAGDTDGALKAAERMLDSLGDVPGQPWIRVLAHSRIGELCLPAGQPARGREQFRIALELVQRLALPADMLQLQQGMALASLPLGDFEAAEQWLEQAELSRNESTAGEFMLDLGVRAEILLARGETDAGLRQWRRAVDRTRTAAPSPFRVEERGLEPETLETEAVAVVAHARHGRLDEVAEVADDLPAKLVAMLADPLDRPPLYLVELPLCGTLLRALSAVDLARGRVASGVRLLALAEAFRYSTGFQPTMSAPDARQEARAADPAGYETAVRECAGLSPQQLRAAALEALHHRTP